MITISLKVCYEIMKMSMIMHPPPPAHPRSSAAFLRLGGCHFLSTIFSAFLSCEKLIISPSICTNVTLLSTTLDAWWGDSLCSDHRKLYTLQSHDSLTLGLK